MVEQRGPLHGHSDERFTGLLIRVAASDEAAFRELYAATSRRTAAVVRRHLGITEQTPGVVQEVFLHVWQHADTFDPRRATALGWLSMLAHRRAVDRVRHVTRSLARDNRYAALEVRSDDVVSDLGLARVESARVRSALRRLDARYRDALVLTFLSGHTNVEAACLLAIPLGTLKTHVRVGLAQLRSLLGPLAA